MQLSYSVISEKGKRENNEDSICPSDDTATINLFIVCDGVGGSAKGEIASNIVCNTIFQYFSENTREQTATKISNAIRKAELKVEAYANANPENRNLSTTLAMVCFENDQANIVHAGDSRVYHVRDGKILFQTLDHSLVNQLVSTGFITSEEAATHPRRNILSRAISGIPDPVEPEINQTSDVRPGDYFFVCSDGILEGIDEKFIRSEFTGSSKKQPDVHKIMKKIGSLCAGLSTDNYSAILIHIDAL